MRVCRRMLYMATSDARRYNPVIGELYSHLFGRSESFKQAMIA